jgi:hypothetical protein
MMASRKAMKKAGVGKGPTKALTRVSRSIGKGKSGKVAGVKPTLRNANKTTSKPSRSKAAGIRSSKVTTRTRGYKTKTVSPRDALGDGADPAKSRSVQRREAIQRGEPLDQVIRAGGGDGEVRFPEMNAGGDDFQSHPDPKQNEV